MTYLGIDYGSKRIGLAFSEGGALSFPLIVIENGRKAVSQILEIIENRKINAIVIGESLNYKNQPNQIMEDITLFKKVLEKSFKGHIYLEPEFLTSVQAEKFSNKDVSDASAASLILQSFLDKVKNK